MRRAEVTNLTWETVNFAANTIKVLGKGGKRRLVPIHPALSEALIEAPPVPGRAIFPGPYGKPLSSTRMHWILKEFAPNARFHDFRRTVASSLYYNGVQGDTIDRVLGWKRRDVRSRYYVRVADEQLQAAILRVYADDPI